MAHNQASFFECRNGWKGFDGFVNILVVPRFVEIAHCSVATGIQHPNSIRDIHCNSRYVVGLTYPNQVKPFGSNGERQRATLLKVRVIEAREARSAAILSRL